MSAVRLEHVTKKFENSIVAVNDVTFEVADTEFVVLVGPSGCGKSTTLRMIAGLEEISAGDIYIEDRRVNDVSPRDRDIAMVFQNYALYPHMTVYANLAFGLKMRKYSKPEIEDRVWRAAAILGIKELLQRKPKALSGGQRQRVALGRAIVRQPKVFLFDEPLSNLDANLRAQMRTEISRLHRQLKSTMIYVTHDQMEAMSMGDRIVVMKDGAVQQIDEPLKIYNQPVNRFVAGFIGSPTMNVFEGTISRSEGTRFTDATGRINFAIDPRRLPEGKILLGVRPEDIIEKPRGEAWSKIAVNVELFEPIGNEALVYFSLPPGGGRYISRSSSEFRPAPGSNTFLYLDTSRIHFFSFEGGAALG